MACVTGSQLRVQKIRNLDSRKRKAEERQKVLANVWSRQRITKTIHALGGAIHHATARQMKKSITDQQDKKLLVRTARAVHALLKDRVAGTGIRLKWPTKGDPAETDGWKATIGVLGVNSPQLQIWLDFQTGYPQRKLWFGFRAVNEKKINHLIGSVAKKYGSSEKFVLFVVWRVISVCNGRDIAT